MLSSKQYSVTVITASHYKNSRMRQLVYYNDTYIIRYEINRTHLSSLPTVQETYPKTK